MPELSVIVCTHNPRRSYLRPVLDGLAAQTLPQAKWELILIDNASEPAIEQELASIGHPGGRLIRENAPGLTHALRRGITEASGELLVLVHDDSVLAANYLEQALALEQEWPELGAWGGQSIGNYEQKPADRLAPWCWIAVREFDRDQWTNVPLADGAMPLGAGLCIRRAVADHYVRSLEKNPLRRQASQLADISGAEDLDLCFTACDIGLGHGIFTNLKLVHLISSNRIHPGYLANQVRHLSMARQLVRYFHEDKNARTPRWTPWQRWKNLRHVSQHERPFVLAQYEGLAQASALIESLEGTKPFRAFEQTPLRLVGEQDRPASTLSPTPRADAAERRKVAADITRLMETDPAFTYLRLGDGELQFLLAMQNNVWSEQRFNPTLRASVEVAFGGPSLKQKDDPRLVAAYERCTWLDRYETVPYNRDHLSELKLNRAPEALANPTPGTSQIFIDWFWYELKDYLTHHRCLFCGAEAALLRELLNQPEYRKISSRFWPADANVFFLQPRRNGSHLSDDLDLIKEDIAAEIDRHRIDTVFLSLAGAAKIIGYELSVEKNIRAFDCGSMLRALTYSGSDGHAVWRSCHHPFLLRVPFGLYMRCLQKAHPDLDSVTLISKAHAQLCLEMLRKEPLQIHTCDLNDASAFDSSRENKKHFLESYADYRRHYYPWAAKQPELRPLLQEFRSWRLKKGLGLDGQLLQAARTLARKMFRRKSA